MPPYIHNPKRSSIFPIWIDTVMKDSNQKNLILIIKKKIIFYLFLDQGGTRMDYLPRK